MHFPHLCPDPFAWSDYKDGLELLLTQFQAVFFEGGERIRSISSRRQRPAQCLR